MESKRVRLVNNRMVARKQSEHDNYETPAWCVESLTKIINVEGTVLEPCCGCGSICRELLRLLSDKIQLTAIDVRDTGYGRQENFFDHEDTYDWMIINPPFKKSTEFLLHAYSHARKGVAVFQRSQWLEGIGRRRDMWKNAWLTDLRMFVHRVGCFQEGQITDIKQGGMLTFAWFIFEKGKKPLDLWIDDKPNFEHDTRRLKND